MENPIPQNSIETAKSGRWSAASTWKGRKVPLAESSILISTGHTVTLDINVTVSGAFVSKGANLAFDKFKSCALNNSGNITVLGKLTMRPSSASHIHSIVLSGIDETKFKGGGMDIMDTDPGIWVRGEGSLDILGTEKTAWCTIFPVKAGSKYVTCTKIPVGFKVGDRISLTPSNTKDYKQFEIRVITKVSKSILYFSEPLEFDHTAELLNLSRNVKIESNAGRSHINIMSKSKQSIFGLYIRRMGPRQSSGLYTEKVLGRYPLHLHMSAEGSVIENVVVEDCGSHAFVSHATHHTTFRNCISYSTYESSYWWDIPPDNGTSPVNNSNYTLIDSCVSAMTLCDPPNRGYRLASFMLGSGIGNKITNCVAVGNQGNNGAAGFLWAESSNYTDNVWIFENNIAHNNRTDGIFTWQNDPHNHIIDGFIGYNNGGNGIEHGAYHNGYKYKNIKLYGNGNGILLHATPIQTGIAEDRYILSFTNVQSTDALRIVAHTLPGQGPVLFKDCKFSSVVINELPARVPNPPQGLYDFVNCTTVFSILSMEDDSLVRVQNNTAYQINSKGEVSPIDLFY